MDNQVKYLEHVQSFITLKATRRGDVTLYLVSPMNTTYVFFSKRRIMFFLNIYFWLAAIWTEFSFNRASKILPFATSTIDNYLSLWVRFRLKIMFHCKYWKILWNICHHNKQIGDKHPKLVIDAITTKLTKLAPKIPRKLYRCVSAGVCSCTRNDLLSLSYR